MRVLVTLYIKKTKATIAIKSVTIMQVVATAMALEENCPTLTIAVNLLVATARRWSVLGTLKATESAIIANASSMLGVEVVKDVKNFHI